VLEVLAACLRHSNDLALHLDRDGHVLPITVFPRQHLFHTPLPLDQLYATRFDSVRLLHRPNPGDDLAAAWRRVRFDELLAQQLSMRFAYRRRRARRSPVLKVNGPLLQGFLQSLPFKLTRAQARAMQQVLQDLANVPAGLDVVAYCDCPNDVSAARLAARLRKRGLPVRVLAGGFGAWVAEGLPVQAV